MMSDGKGAYTPGGWEWRGDLLVTQDYAGILSPGEKVLFDDRGSGIVAEEADRRLIAAAPDLLEALDKCRAIIKFHCKPGKCVSLNGAQGPVFSALDAHDAAVAAIARALGTGDEK